MAPTITFILKSFSAEYWRNNCCSHVIPSSLLFGSAQESKLWVKHICFSSNGPSPAQTVLEHSSEDQPSPANQREPWLPRDWLTEASLLWSHKPSLWGLDVYLTYKCTILGKTGLVLQTQTIKWLRKQLSRSLFHWAVPFLDSREFPIQRASVLPGFLG